MAKLNGIKTLDMVNGEITKVAYGGAEYVKAEGLPKMGDLVRAEEGRYDITYGAFYRITEDADHEDDVKFLDDVDDERVRDDDDYVIFRKVSASTGPSLEERVSSAEGEIESLKSDVAALKGESEYKRIGKSEARAGDYVKFIETDDEDITIGELYEIEAIDCDGDPVFTDDIGQENYATSDDPYEVSDNAYNHPRGTLIRIEGGNCFRGSGFATPDQLEILSEEEAAEIERKQAEEAKWAKIGRKVGEYKKGDVVRYDYGDNEICEVVDDTEEGRVGVQTKDYGVCREKPDNLRLITPVEARFDR